MASFPTQVICRHFRMRNGYFSLRSIFIWTGGVCQHLTVGGVFMPGRPLLGRIGLCSPRWAASAPTAAPEWEALQPELGPFSTSVMSGRMQEQGFQMRKKGSVTMMIRGDY